MINLENILKLENKIQLIYENSSLNFSKVTTLCEDWWEITQEEQTLQELGLLFREPRFKEFLKIATLNECVIISIAYVISLHIETPTKLILNLLWTSLYYVHQNFLLFIELILKWLPPENWTFNWSKKLETIVLSKSDAKNLEKNEIFWTINKNNEILYEHILKLCSGKISEKEMKSQKLSLETMDIWNYFSPISKAFLTIVEDIILHPYNYLVSSARENMIKALDGFNNAMMMFRENPSEMHPMYKVGGTALGNKDEAITLVDAPYLDPPSKVTKRYCLVLDLDETLVHYFETNNQGKCLIRPGVSQFLFQMNKYFEVVIFTAAM